MNFMKIVKIMENTHVPFKAQTESISREKYSNTSSVLSVTSSTFKSGIHKLYVLGYLPINRNSGKYFIIFIDI